MSTYAANAVRERGSGQVAARLALCVQVHIEQTEVVLFNFRVARVK